MVTAIPWGSARVICQGLFPPSLSKFIDNSKTVLDIDVNLVVDYEASDMRLHRQFGRNQLKTLLDNDVLLTSCHAILIWKSDKCLTNGKKSNNKNKQQTKNV